MIEVQGIDVYYGNIQALKGVSLLVRRCEIVTVIGSNGAGKSTLQKAIVGLLRKRAGEIRFDGKPITSIPTADIIRRGSPSSLRVAGCWALSPSWTI